MIHPARELSFDELYQGLQDGIRNEAIREVAGDDGLRLYVYTEKCTYDKLWGKFSLMARGLILDVDRKEIVATPFPKFFNVGENAVTVPDLPFETFEKLDGSLIIVFYHNGQWKTATKGSFKSDQAKWALARLPDGLGLGHTYLFEAIYPENRIVVHYDYEGLVLLSAYNHKGEELPYEMLSHFRIAKRYSYTHVSELLAKAATLPASEEGFVLRFSNGLRLKVKGDEYCRIHRLVSRVTPLAMWEAMKNGDNMEEIRKQLPEEFWTDFDNIISILDSKVTKIVLDTISLCSELEDLSDKDVGIRLQEYPEHIRPYIFPMRRNKTIVEGRTREALFRNIRPTGNRLEGYAPSSAMNRVTEAA